jgi:hypothetical protein
MIPLPDRQAIEREIVIDCSKALSVWNFDESGNFAMAHCMKGVDFLIEWKTEVWLVEIKDPSSSIIPKKHKEKQLAGFKEKFKSDTLFSQELGPKVKDSFLYLYLDDSFQDKPIRYFVLIGMDELDSVLLERKTQVLEKCACLFGPNGNSWKNKYIDTVAVFNLPAWNKHLSHCPATRRKQGG